MTARTASPDRRNRRDEVLQIDPKHPGTALERLHNIHARVRGLSVNNLSGTWQEVRRQLLWAGGLRDLPNNLPGQGYTGHAFNDDNHSDLCAMLGQVSDNLYGENFKDVALASKLGPGIEVASLPELGPGGSWITCTNGSMSQFRARIAFKLVWCPPAFDSFVLVDDVGDMLNYGTPTGTLPDIQWRRNNYDLTRGSNYAREVETFQGQFDNCMGG
jgi:hypothetical protein